jgi:hypothetical protein
MAGLSISESKWSHFLYQIFLIDSSRPGIEDVGCMEEISLDRRFLSRLYLGVHCTEWLQHQSIPEPFGG